MRVCKTADGGCAGMVSGEDLALINRLAQKNLTEEDVYVFAVKLCDNEIDRDGERFAPQTLDELAELFVGKTGLFDHQWSAREQAARLFRTQVVREDGLTQAGDRYCYLKGWAYMLRTEGNQELIAEIEGGIKKEVSVGCAVERAACSVCGGEPGTCGHRKGERYGGKLCFSELTGATDAYEWSFVAVPAQKNAGVMKQMRRERLEQEAELGRRYLKQLRREVARMGGLAGSGLDAPALERIAEKLDEPELLELKRAYEGKLRKKWPARTQLSYGAAENRTDERDESFLI